MRSEKLNDDALHELEVIDAVVRGGGHARPEDAALTDFALLLRAARPLPDHGAALRLDERLAGASSRPPARRRRQLLAAVASLVLVLGVGGVALNSFEQVGGRDSSAEAPSTAGAPVTANSFAGGEPELSTQGDAVGGERAIIAPELASPVAKAPQRSVARDATLTLATEGRKVETLSDRVIAVVDDAGGYVATSRVRRGAAGTGTATFQLMLPASTFQETFAELSRLAHVRSRSQSTEDISAQTQGANRSLARARARVAELSKRLDAAESDAERRSLKMRLARAKFVERQALRQVRSNRSRVNYVPLSLKVVADDKAAAAEKGTIVRALERAAEILTGIAAFLIVALAVALPLALVLAAASFGGRWLRRSRKSRTLADAAAQPE